MDATVFLTRSQNKKFGNKIPGRFFNQKNRPTCSHCGFTGHTVDKRSKTKVSSEFPSNSAALHLPFTMEQCQQHIALLHPSSESSTVNQSLK